MTTPFNILPIFKIVIPFIIGIITSNFILGCYSLSLEFFIFLLVYFIGTTIFLPRSKTLKSIYWILSFFVMGSLHWHFSQLEYDTQHFSKFKNAKILVHSIEDITLLTKSTRLLTIVEYAGVHTDSLREVDGKMMVYLKGLQTDIDLGGKLVTTADYALEQDNKNPHVFDYKRYLNHRGIYHRMRLDTNQYQLINTTAPKTLSVRAKLIRNSALDILKGHLKDENSLAVAAAMILGERNLLNDDLYDAFTDTGAVHVLAVSGLHVGIVGTLFLFLLNRAPLSGSYAEAIKASLLIAVIWLFAIMTGMAAAVTRAALMFTLFYVAKGIKRQRNPYNLLSAAALMMLIFHPAYIYQAGFQFSFLALLGIIFFFPPIFRTLLFKNKLLKWLWGLIAVSISAQALVSPLAIFYFHKLPLYFWLTGMVAVPAAGLILWLGIFLLIFSFILGEANIISQLLGVVLNWCIEKFNWFIFKVQELPFCSAEELWLSNLSLVLIYIAIGLFAIFVKTKKPKLLIAAGLVLILQITSHNIEKIQKHKIDKLVVYDSYRGSIIDWFQQGTVYQYASTDIDEKSINYVAKNNRLYNRAMEVKSLSSASQLGQQGFHLINNELHLLYPSQAALDYVSELPVSLLVLSGDSYNNLNKLAANFDIQKIVLDGTTKYKSKSIKRMANELGIPIHETSVQGAYEKII